MTPKEKEPLKFLAQHLCYGLAAGATFGGLVLATDLGHIRTLAMDSPNPAPVLIMLFLGLFVTFGSVAMGVGIMGLARDDEDGNDLY
ncbi:MAG: hypothetical protein HY055_13360 [Magnetospirillum sp.]|nr:hypothetical protein [Magnetospirillum sp.]